MIASELVAISRVLPSGAAWAALEEAQHALVERSASYAGPGGVSIRASDTDAQDQAGMFEQPNDHWMVHTEEPVNAHLGVELQGAEKPTDELDADFHAAVALRVVGGRVLLRDGS